MNPCVVLTTNHPQDARNRIPKAPNASCEFKRPVLRHCWFRFVYGDSCQLQNQRACLRFRAAVGLGLLLAGARFLGEPERDRQLHGTDSVRPKCPEFQGFSGCLIQNRVAGASKNCHGRSFPSLPANLYFKNTRSFEMSATRFRWEFWRRMRDNIFPHFVTGHDY